jgi:tetratricopeptide (TPR) repeat protein/transglutaminase-like putative cysteine protease
VFVRFAAFVLLLSSFAAAQTTPPRQASDYSKEALVIEHHITRATFQADGNSVRETSAVLRLQAEAAVQSLAVLRFQYSSSYETVDIDYVRVRKPDGTVVVTPAYNTQEMPAEVTRTAPLYSDVREKHVTVKALGVGDTLEYLVRYRSLKPEVSDQFWFQYNFTKDAIVQDEELDLTIPRNKYVKISSPELKPQIKDEATTRTYSWKSTNLVRKDTTEQAPQRYQPNPSVQLTTFRTWDDVGRWYGDLQKTQVIVTPEIRAKAAELTKGLTSDDDRIRALYSFVSTRVHYISLSFGIGRYQPHVAEEVLENEYGDCKDKHTLLAALLKAAGYDAAPALISSSRKLDPDVPSPAQFDHVITVVPRGSNVLWLDTTPEVAPFGMLLANLRDKQSLVIADGKAASLQTTPANPPFPTLLSFTAEGKLDDSGGLRARVQRSVRGDVEVIFRSGFRQVPQPQWQDLVQRISYASGFAGEVSAVTASAPADTAKPFEFSYDYKRKDYSDWANRRIAPPFPPFGIEVRGKDDKKPSEPLLLGAPGEVVYRAKIELPSRSKPNLPKNVDVSDDFAEYHATYKLDHNILLAERRFVIKKSEVALASWDEYRKFRKTVTDDEDQYIDLNLVGGNTAAGTSAVASSADPELVRISREGFEALQNRDLTTAEEDFRKILARDPKFPNAHGYAGIIDTLRNRNDEGIRELLAEEEITPDEPLWYRVLGSVYARLNREDDAIDQWRKLVHVDPKNREAAAVLGNALMRKTRYAEAVQVLEGATAQSPDSPTLQASLGHAYLETKQADKAEAALKKAVELDPSPVMLNNVAYYAAENGILLDLSKQWAEGAVSQLEAETAKITLAELHVEDLQRVNSLAKYWDTLGWVYFRTNDLPKAEKYLHAAWVLTQSSVTGDHLAQVYEREGKRKEAAHMYELAYAEGRPNDEAADRYKKLTNEDLIDATTPKLVRRPNSTSVSAPTWPGEELSRMRTVKLPTITSKSASAQFFVLVSPGGKGEPKFINGSETLRNAGPRLAAIKYPVEFPDLAPARILRRGILTCGVAGCEFTLLLPGSVQSIN